MWFVFFFMGWTVSIWSKVDKCCDVSLTFFPGLCTSLDLRTVCKMYFLVENLHVAT